MKIESILYPPLSAEVQHSLQVDNLHRLHVEESGNPNGIPVLFVHGGPGGGCSPVHRQFFNPNRYRIILFDQRGCGKSRPHACLTNNTTAHLIEDIEKIRRLLGIEAWCLFGGSWGSTLSLLYAQAYPERVTALVLRGIFLCRPEDVAWFYQQGANRFFPQAWQDFLAPVAIDQRENMVQAYYDLLTSDNEVARMRAAEAWSVWEGRTSTLQPSAENEDHFSDPYFALAMARIECHYFRHNAFIEANQILDNTEVLANIPIKIIHGHYDMVCPVNQAYDLAEKLPHADLIICHQAGHSAMEVGNAEQLVKATDELIPVLDRY